MNDIELKIDSVNFAKFFNESPKNKKNQSLSIQFETNVSRANYTLLVLAKPRVVLVSILVTQFAQNAIKVEDFQVFCTKTSAM